MNNVLKIIASVSMLSIGSKIFEKIRYDNIYNYVTDNNLTPQIQSGLKRGGSCVLPTNFY